MPRANRYFLKGHIWHLTHRCHKQEFLLKFARDRNRWRHWLFEARKRYDLCVLNYVITSNHIHLLVLDRGQGEIAKSMQLVAGRTAQQYNARKNRKGAFWEDRYHATAVDTETYLARCIAYIDLNMVRAGVARMPEDWCWGGYHEILSPPSRYSVIDIDELLFLFAAGNLGELQEMRQEWIADALRNNDQKQPMWTNSIAVGSEKFVEQVKQARGIHIHRKSIKKEQSLYTLQEQYRAYTAHFMLEKASISSVLAPYRGANTVKTTT